MKLIYETDFQTSEPRALRIVHMGGGHVAHVDFAGVRALKQSGQMQKRRLACARRRNQRNRLAGP